MSLPTALCKIAAPWKLTMYFNSTSTSRPGRGWVESYFFDTASDYSRDSAGLATNSPSGYSTIMSHRMYLLGAGASLVWARVSRTGANQTGRCVQATSTTGSTLNSESPLASMDSGGSGIVFRGETASGKHFQRFMHGVREAWVLGDAIPSGTISNVGTFYDNGDAYETSTLDATKVCKNWAIALATLTFRCSKSPTGSYFIAEPWTKAALIGNSNRLLGRGFRVADARRR